MNTVFPLWFQFGTMAALAVILIIDLLLVVKRPHVPDVREASLWVGGYVLLALLLAGCMFLIGDQQHGVEFLAGWLTEYSLSLDNLFVFVLIIARFQVPKPYQQRALLIGIVFALVLRGVFILLGAQLIERFVWVFFLFGAWLLWTAYGQLRAQQTVQLSESWVVRALKRVLPFSDEFDGGKLRVSVAGKRKWTPFLMVLVALGSTDLLFALDSIPAIFGITQSAFIVFTANVCALMGLRQLYFLLGDMLDRLKFLKYGVVAILAFIGIKLIVHALHENQLPFINGGQPVAVPEIDIWFSLAFIVAAILVATVSSLIWARGTLRTRHSE